MSDDVARILSRLDEGDLSATDELLPLVYSDLRALAARRLAGERPGQTLQATALVHEVWLRLSSATGTRRWESQGHFFAAAAEAMRRILVDRARHKATVKAGGGRARVDLSVAEPQAADATVDVLALHEALNRLEARDPRKAELVKLRYFAGLTIRQAAHALGIAPSTADLDWAYARSWLRVELDGGGGCKTAE